MIFLAYPGHLLNCGLGKGEMAVLYLPLEHHELVTALLDEVYVTKIKQKYKQ
jgi:hypothetical protein